MASTEIGNTKMVVFILKQGANKGASRNGDTAYALIESSEV